jgi:gas vesicle protein
LDRQYPALKIFSCTLAERTHRLRELAEEAKSVINNADSNSLKYSESLRNHIHDQMSQLKDSIDESIEDIPRRRIRMENTDDMEMEYPAAQSA